MQVAKIKGKEQLMERVYQVYNIYDDLVYEIIGARGESVVKEFQVRVLPLGFFSDQRSPQCQDRGEDLQGLGRLSQGDRHNGRRLHRPL